MVTKYPRHIGPGTSVNIVQEQEGGGHHLARESHNHGHRRRGEDNLLFKSALRSCDFDMSRAVASQSQMDPPPLERVELIQCAARADAFFTATSKWWTLLMALMTTNTTTFSVCANCDVFKGSNEADKVQLLSEVVLASEKVPRDLCMHLIGGIGPQRSDEWRGGQDGRGRSTVLYVLRRRLTVTCTKSVSD